MAVKVTTDSEFKDILSSNNKVAVKFYADWCGQCKLMAPKYRKMSDLEEFEDVLFLDINAEENQEARKMAGVNNLPFFAVFKDGELLEGRPTSKKEKVQEMIQSLS
jgi:thiol-disulfide isomerase/thioredoxin